MRIALSAMTCSGSGASESLVSYNWLCQIARFNDVSLITSEPKPPKMKNVSANIVSNKWWPLRFLSDGFKGAVKPHYFVFDRRAGKQCADVIKQADVFHHVIPQAPRYASSLGRMAKRFVLGPVGGGLRVPEAFRTVVERSEPFFSRLRNLDSLRFRHDPWLRATYEAADTILLTAPYMLDILPAEYHSKVEFLAETGIDADLYRDEPMFSSDKDEVTVLYVGRITPYKGLEFLLRGVAMLPTHILKSVRVAVVGSGEEKYEQRCRRLLAQAGLSDRVTFYGRIDKAEVLDHYRAADIFCFPTLAETTGNVLLEAMAMGLPIVSTNYGGPAAVVSPDSGILVDPDSPEAFSAGISAAIKDLVVQRDRRILLGKQARQHVLSNLSWDAKGRQISEIYDRLVREVASD